MAAPLLEVRGLRVDIDSGNAPMRALDDVSLTMQRGEILGVVGESGAGKSLLGAALIGLMPPAARLVGGTLHFEGQRIDKLSPAGWRHVRGRGIGAIFQDPMTALDPLQTVGQQLIETLRAHHPMAAGGARQRAAEWLRATGIAAPEQRIDDPPHRLSGGMRQRAVIALALAPEPRLVIADEPTTALDVSVQAQVLAVLRDLCRTKGTAMLLVTHDMGVVAETCERVAVMYAGRLVEIGPVQDVAHAPAHPYTAGLMAAIPQMNEDRPELAQIAGAMPRLDDIPSGCAFHPRCPHAFERCRNERPPMFTAGAVQAACWLHAGPVVQAA